MITLYITRHGETEWNSEGRLQGSLNSNLTANGIKNAQSLGERLQELEFVAVYASPSGRTKQTAQVILEDREIPIIYDNNLKEINMGEWEGETLIDVEGLYPEQFHAFWNLPHEYTPVGGETFEDAWNRALQILGRIKEEQKNGNVLIVTHGVLIKCLISIFKNALIEDLWSPPFIHDTSLTVVNMTEADYEILLEGDISHKGTAGEKS
ncbi:histidine phosphatase family protein [Bacillus solimangrovi]|uniref:Phosphatase n=1 Tax=Bacillus solimangrovi TaxID=1305675 RepID=A0A1E5LII0_9BACI|nr:histidine phosphatase family protein [Bacillus solimangrovi]OEH93856.1 phosphatase [Bacillus solimangrovi]